MKKKLVAAALLLVGFVLGIAAARALGGGEPEIASAEVPDIAFPAAALKAWFPPISEYDTGGEPLPDESLDALLAALDDALSDEATLADFGLEADIHLWNFIRRLAVPEVTDAQRERIAAHLEELRQRHPGHDDMFAHHSGSVAFFAHAAGVAPTFPGIPAMSGVSNPGFALDSTTQDGAFTDAHVDALLNWVGTVLTMPETANDFSHEAGRYFGALGQMLQRAEVTGEQRERVFAHLEEIKASNEHHAEAIDEEVEAMRSLLPGGVAPNIVGHDTEGIEFSLEDYRGNIVVLVFSGHWCGPCRVEYPYHRFMLELYRDRPVVLLGVNSDGDIETIRGAKIDEGLDYRTWWDGHAAIPTMGPIATAWRVVTWPSIYILDENGVIRHVDKRGGDLIATVDRMLVEMTERAAEAERKSEADQP